MKNHIIGTFVASDRHQFKICHLFLIQHFKPSHSPVLTFSLNTEVVIIKVCQGSQMILWVDIGTGLKTYSTHCSKTRQEEQEARRGERRSNKNMLLCLCVCVARMTLTDVLAAAVFYSYTPHTHSQTLISLTSAGLTCSVNVHMPTYCQHARCSLGGAEDGSSYCQSCFLWVMQWQQGLIGFLKLRYADTRDPTLCCSSSPHNSFSKVFILLPLCKEKGTTLQRVLQNCRLSFKKKKQMPLH